MASLHQSLPESENMPSEVLIARVNQIHASLCKLESLKPSKQFNDLYTQLVKICTLPSAIDVKFLAPNVQLMRNSLINLLGRAESLRELEFATFLTSIPQPLHHLQLYPHYENYVKLSSQAYSILYEHGVVQPKKVAFMGSGPMPLSSIIMATNHMQLTHFDNFDIDESANDVASKMVASDAELERRMKFYTFDVMDMREKLGEYDCIFLAALVGRSKVEKVKILAHIRKYMKDGGILLARSANGARAFLYHVVDEDDFHGFEILSTAHPSSKVINSVVLVRKPVH